MERDAAAQDTTGEGRGRVLMITGASRGIGAACAVHAAAAGFAVCVNYVAQRDAADAVVGRIESAGGRAVAVQADASRETDVLRLFETCDRTLGRVTDLINNAGVVAPARRVDQMDADRLERIFRVNLVGPFLVAREALRRMSPRHGGHGGVIVNISSVAARLGAPNEYVDYAASKSGIDALTVGLAKEVADESIRVVGIRPGLIETDIHASGGEPDRIERLRPLIPVKRPGTADEIARVALFLLGSGASYMTGTIVDVSGGR
jgi:NAD(P)-dependent dehydrogenase (short-subunit alcohol dehydrogenase family)